MLWIIFLCACTQVDGTNFQLSNHKWLGLFLPSHPSCLPSSLPTPLTQVLRAKVLLPFSSIHTWALLMPTTTCITTRLHSDTVGWLPRSAWWPGLSCPCQRQCSFSRMPIMAVMSTSPTQGLLTVSWGERVPPQARG